MYICQSYVLVTIYFETSFMEKIYDCFSRSPVWYFSKKTVNNYRKIFQNSRGSNHLMGKYVSYNVKSGTHWSFKQVLLVYLIKIYDKD